MHWSVIYITGLLSFTSVLCALVYLDPCLDWICFCIFSFVCCFLHQIRRKDSQKRWRWDWKRQKMHFKKKKGKYIETFIAQCDLLNVSADHDMIRPFYYRVYNNFYSISTLHNTSACFLCKSTGSDFIRRNIIKLSGWSIKPSTRCLTVSYILHCHLCF